MELSKRFAIFGNLERTQEIQRNQEDENLSSTIDTKWQSWRNIIVETGEKSWASKEEAGKRSGSQRKRGNNR